jgi:hypothetical protein
MGVERTDCQGQDFSEWVAQVMATMEAIGKSGGSTGGSAIDAAIPYRLGWSPERTARALLFLDHRDYYHLREQILFTRVKDTASLPTQLPSNSHN